MPLTTLHVLVVDDVASSRDALAEMVRALGHKVVAVDSGVAALAALNTRLPDVVFLELWMAGMDGFELSRRIRALPDCRWLPLMVTSVRQGEQSVIDALAHGADDSLAKPVNATLLEAKLRHCSRFLGLQSRLASMAQRQRDIQDNILDAVLTLDEHEHIVDANLAACRTFSNGTPAGLVGHGLRVATGFDLPSLAGPGQCVLRRLDGANFPAEVSASEWREAGEVRTTLVVRDLTEQRRNERMRDEFLAIVSHELRTPLTSVLGAIGLLASGAAGPLPALSLPLVAAAQRNGERLSKLIDDVLDLTKLEGDRMVMNLRSQPLVPLLHEAVAANQGYAVAAKVRLALFFDLEAVHGAAQVRVDADRFLQVMANLLSNAIKHSPAGTAVTVRISAEAHGYGVTVSDCGRGIDPRFLARLFEKFSQADSSDGRPVGGTGLGLYIARLLVERMGGRIYAEQGAQPGEGATFRLWFPATAIDPPGAARRADPQTRLVA